MNPIFEPYKALLGAEVINTLYEMADLLKGIKVVHVNSTKEGGGVAEILTKMVPLTNALGLETHWLVLKGNPEFYECTKMFHNQLQGKGGPPPSYSYLSNYEKTNAENAEQMQILNDADIVVIHDPQPAALISHFPNRKGKWIWRCHIDASSPSRAVWKYLEKYIKQYDASIFSLEDFTHELPHPIFLIAPSIDPLSEKNIELDWKEIVEVHNRFEIDLERPTMLQVSRFDRFKDPLGVIESYKMAKKFNSSLQLVLAGGGASDDPEGELVLKEVATASKDDPDIHVLFLPPDVPRVINALQRGSYVVLQKSIKEGFSLTVSEALWKEKAVIGGDTGGIRLQIVNHHTGFLVNTPEGAALRIRYLLQNPEKNLEIGRKGKTFVKENFLITRNIRDYLTLMASLLYPSGNGIDFSKKVKLS